MVVRGLCWIGGEEYVVWSGRLGVFKFEGAGSKERARRFKRDVVFPWRCGGAVGTW